MATTTLTLYKGCKLDRDKNFIVDNLEDYLATLETKVITKYQYQRFELIKFIKIDLSQDYATNSNDVSIGKKWNYCKFVTPVGENGSATYYYFVTGYRQISQKTIELELAMDTLNTYSLGTTENNNSYILSPKTTVKREHKDRLVKTGTTETFRIRNPYLDEMVGIDRWKNTQWYRRSDFTITFQFSLFLNKWKETPVVGMTWPVYITPNDVSYKLYVVRTLPSGNVETVSNYELRPGYTIEIDLEGIKFTKVGETSATNIYWRQLSDLNQALLIEVISSDVAGGTPSSFSPSANWTYIKDYFYETKIFEKLAIDNIYRREIDEYNEGINTILFKHSEQTLYDADNTNQWYLTYLSKNPVVTGDETAPNYVNPVIAELYSDAGYTISPRTAHEVTVYATDIKTNYPNQPELIGYNGYFSPFTAGIHGLIPYFGPTNQPKHVLYEDIAPIPTARGQQYIKCNGVTYDAYDYGYILFMRTNNSDTTFSHMYAARRVTPGPSGINDGLYVPPVEVVGPIDSFIVYGLNTLRQMSGYYDTAYQNIFMYVERWDHLDVYSGETDSEGTCPPFKERDLTDSRLIKIFNFPYAPLDWLVGNQELPFVSDETYTYDTTDNALKILKLQNVDFTYQKQLPYSSPFSEVKLRYTQSNLGKEKPRDMVYESKLFHSDYYQPKFVYDSFSFPFNLENVNAADLLSAFPAIDNTFTFTYSVTRNILSKFMFQFDECLLKKSTLDYDNVLLVNRNNEKALYTNAFINYVRSGGYNNDAQKNQDQQTMNGIASGIGLATSIGSLVAGIAATASGYGAPMGVGAILGGVAGIASSTVGLAKSIVTAQEQDKAFAQKTNELQMQGTTVIGNEDIDLLTQFSDNKPKLVYYRLSNMMRDAMWDLFHYEGYATNETKVPTHDSRLYFNFVQADIEYEYYNFNEDIADDIKEKWAGGVTFIHKVRNSANTAYIWDMDQEYENFEVSLLQ